MGIRVKSGRGSGAKPIEVVVVSDSPETLDGLREYLWGAGITTEGCRRLDGLALEKRPVAAVVLFPDDFVHAEVFDLVASLARDRSNIRTLIVTGHPRRYEPLTTMRGVRTVPIVIPKPAWGWTILDSIQAHLEGVKLQFL